MNRRSLLFRGIAAALLLLLVGPAWAQDDKPYDTSGQDGGMWLIPGASTYTKDVDILYKVIFWVVIAMFLLTEGLLVYFCIVYRRRPGHRPIYSHGNKKAEIIWTVVPAAMLLALAIVQIGTWNDIKQPSRFPKPGEPKVTAVDVFAETFNWNYRYPQAANSYKAPVDLTVGRLIVPFGNKVVCRLRSRDVIHSMFIPHMRVKQDTVPGLRQGLWFEPARIWIIELDPATKKGTKRHWVNDPRAFEENGPEVTLDGKPVKLWDKRIAVDSYVESEVGFSPAYNELPDGTYDVIKTPQGVKRKVNVLHRAKVYEKQEWDSCEYAVGLFEVACAELCGMGHYKMKSILAVLPRPAYEKWLRDEEKDLKEFADVRGPGTPPIWKLWKE